MQWEAVIGLEIHVQLATASKLFSGASSAYGAAPNTQACEVDLGLPGVLPVVNRRAMEMAVLLGLAIGAEIAPVSIFARKNYFYPDLPKGYQISQYERPIVQHGKLEIAGVDGKPKTIRILRAHLEEDAGKSVHDAFPGISAVDLNRAGTPLLEVVTEPDMSSAAEAVAYMRALHTLVRYLGICDGNMQEGSFRCDANVSVRRVGDPKLGTRTETKNLNSFRFVERAIEHEIERQTEIIESGGKIVQETRLYDSTRDETRSMRGKEDAHDYRYFPDPDLLPLAVTQADLDTARERLPELPGEKKSRFMAQYGLNEQDATALVQEREVAAYFEQVESIAPGDPKQVANWISGEVFAALNRSGLAFTQLPIPSSGLAALLVRIRDKTISGSMAKQVFDEMWETGDTPDAIIDRRGFKQITDDGAIAVLVDEVIAASPAQVEQYRAGKDKVFGYFVGQVMKNSKGRANPQQITDILKARLDR